jgi:tetratricopeptide (TPR) repeat protein
MTKAVFLSLGLFVLAAFPGAAFAQTSAADQAVNRAIRNQADTIMLRKELVDAGAAITRGDIEGAAKLYEDAYTLVGEIGSGIDAETTQTIAGLAATHLELAKRYQAAGRFNEANREVMRVLKVDPTNPAALDFKQRNDQLAASMVTRMPDQNTIEKIPGILAAKTNAEVHVQNGKLLYEAGKFQDAEDELTLALQLDPDNKGAAFYINLCRQADFARHERERTVNEVKGMTTVEQEWTPKGGIPNYESPLNLPKSDNPYAQTNQVHTSPGREVIFHKLDTIMLDKTPDEWANGIPLSEIIRYLIIESKARDPEKKGINFMFNPNVEAPPNAPTATTTGTLGAGGGIGGIGGIGGGRGGGRGGGGGGAEGLQNINPATGFNPATGLPEAGLAAQPATPQTLDPGDFMVKLTLSNVRLIDVLDAVILLATDSQGNRIKYSVEDYGVIFSGKPNTGPEPPTLEMRVFRIDPNTFYQGMQGVGSGSFGSTGGIGLSGGGGFGGGGFGGGGFGGGGFGGGGFGGGGFGNNGGGFGNNGGGFGNNGGGFGNNGGGFGNNGGGFGNNGGGFGGGGIGGGTSGSGVNVPTVSINGINYLTTRSATSQNTTDAKDFFNAIGINLSTAGRSVAFNDRLGLLYVNATPGELDKIERVIQTLNQVAPEVHIKARFIEIQQNDNAALGFDWYLGQIGMGNVVANGGSAPSQNVPVSAANPLGAFPGNSTTTILPPAAGDQVLTSSLQNTGPALATITGIMTDPNFRVVLHALEQRNGVEQLAEPEVTTISGRQTQMKATDLQYIVVGYSFGQSVGGTSGVGGVGGGGGIGGIGGVGGGVGGGGVGGGF